MLAPRLGHEGVEFVVVAVEPVRILEETLAAHRKKLPGALGCILVEGDKSTLVERLRKPLLARSNAAYPLPPRCCGGQRRDAVDLAIQHVDGVGALMDHHAAWSVAHPAPIDHTRP